MLSALTNDSFANNNRKRGKAEGSAEVEMTSDLLVSFKSLSAFKVVAGSVEPSLRGSW